MKFETNKTDGRHFFNFISVFLKFGHGFIEDNFGGSLNNRSLTGLGKEL
jgi:hypothetical protein